MNESYIEMRPSHYLLLATCIAIAEAPMHKNAGIIFTALEG
jgi:hypothetical protein